MFVSEKGMVWREMRMGRWEALARPGLVYHGKESGFYLKGLGMLLSGFNQESYKA